VIILFLAILAWVVMVACGGIIGNARGRLLDGVVYAMILGPLGWFLVYMLPPSFPPCPRCGTPHRAKYPLCNGCGNPLPVWVQCPRCSTKLDATGFSGGAGICTGCRAEVEIEP
jgi:hypothetical protein